MRHLASVLAVQQLASVFTRTSQVDGSAMSPGVRRIAIGWGAIGIRGPIVLAVVFADESKDSCRLRQQYFHTTAGCLAFF